ncbi:hypothetical protein Vi05172_g9672 [Venturia inaequalis]|nr:hypothetical protein Vi05172_g9672 [Venturia inaequalis]
MKSEILISGSTPKPDEDRKTGIAYFNQFRLSIDDANCAFLAEVN